MARQVEIRPPEGLFPFHRSLLADTARTEAYRSAVLETVNEGDVVLDLGSGTGILAFFACEAGASRVYAVEAQPIIDLARMVAEANRLAERVVFINQLSQRVELPEPVDVILTETLGNDGLGEGILGSVIDARRRFLKSGGRIVPHSVELIAAPVEAPADYHRVEMWTDELHGLDFSPVRSHAANNVYSITLSERSLLAAPAQLLRVELGAVEATDVGGTTSVVARRDGVIHGMGVWFDAALSESVQISTEPPLSMPSWAHAFFPIERPLELRAGETIELELSSMSNGAFWKWALRSGEAVFEHSTFRGLFLSPERLRELVQRQPVRRGSST